MSKIKIYSNSICFLDIYSKLLTNVEIEDADLEMNLLRLKNLFQRCEFHLCDSIDIKNPIALHYFKREGKTLVSNVIDLIPEKYHLVIIDKDDLECNELSNETGILHVNPSFLLTKPQSLFVDILISVKKDKVNNKFHGWDFLEKLIFPVDCLLINDNHFMDSPDLLENNIFSFIKWISKNKSKKRFEITIVTNSSKNLLKSAVNKLEALINSNIIFDSFNFQINAFNAKQNKKHDREIFSNYLWIYSGHTLAIRNTRGEIKDDTTIRVSSIFWEVSSLNDFSIVNSPKYFINEYKNQMVNDFRAVIAPVENFFHEINLIGSKENRIFNLA